MANGDLRFRVGDVDPTDDTNTAMTIAASGSVGVGTTEPDPSSQLTLEAHSNAQLMLRTEDLKHVGVLRTSKQGTLLLADVAKDDLILSADGDSSGMVWIKSTGRVGIGVSDPAHKLGIEDGSAANLALYRTGGVKLGLAADATGAWIGTETNHDLKFRINEASDAVPKMTLTTDGWLGIGTESPKAHLDARGAVVMGNTGQYYAVGSHDNSKLLAGFVPGGSYAGTGWSASHKTSGSNHYDIEFDDSFAATPFVTVTLASDNHPSAVPMVTARSTAGFTVTFGGVNLGDDIAFCFMVMGTR